MSAKEDRPTHTTCQHTERSATLDAAGAASHHSGRRREGQKLPQSTYPLPSRYSGHSTEVCAEWSRRYLTPEQKLQWSVRHN